MVFIMEKDKFREVKQLPPCRPARKGGARLRTQRYFGPRGPDGNVERRKRSWVSGVKALLNSCL